MPLDPRDPRLAYPLYSLHEAAHYLNVPVATLHYWTRRGLVTTVEPAGGSRVPFVGFTEAFVIKAARRAGVRSSRIGPSVEALKRMAGGLEHALASQLVWTDGVEILWGIAGADLEVPRTSQRQFRKVVESNLRLITYGTDGFAEYIQLPQYEHSVVTVDPLVAGGSPIIRSGIGIRVEDVIDRIKAGEPRDQVAKSFGIPLAEVAEVVTVG